MSCSLRTAIVAIKHGDEAVLDKYLQPEAIPLVEETTTCQSFDNAVRTYGVKNACEWFGVEADFVKATVLVLLQRAISF